MQQRYTTRLILGTVPGMSSAWDEPADMTDTATSWALVSFQGQFQDITLLRPNKPVATHHFTVYFTLCVNDPSGGGVVVHSPPNTADFLNLTHVFVAWVCPHLFYLPTEDLGQRRIVVYIYIGFLMIFVILQFYDALGGFNSLATSERDWLFLFFVVGHLVGVNPVLTVLALLSTAFQARRILHGPVTNAFSVPSLAAQGVTFALVAVSWVWRVCYDGSPRFVENPVLDWYFKFGWPLAGNAVFAIAQIALLYAVIQRQRSATGLSGGRETEPLLGGSS
ncbi:hypothetical protein BDW67DRAFT_185411 [Aspergillus spinulosporus]